MANTALKQPAAARAPATGKLSRTVQPTLNERFFDKDDIIVSKTDVKSRITYVNRTFMAISDYDEAELLGQPHSMIRHPDCPRAIFKLLYQRLENGKEVFFYEKNMTKTGDFYWVFGHATPSINPAGETVGYHSNRRVADQRIVREVIAPLYRTLVQIENAEPDRRVGLEKSWAHLETITQNMESGYDSFILGL